MKYGIIVQQHTKRRTKTNNYNYIFVDSLPQINFDFKLKEITFDLLIHISIFKSSFRIEFVFY